MVHQPVRPRTRLHWLSVLLLGASCLMSGLTRAHGVGATGMNMDAVAQGEPLRRAASQDWLCSAVRVLPKLPRLL